MITEQEQKHYRELLFQDRLDAEELVEFQRLDALIYPIAEPTGDPMTFERTICIAAFTKSKRDQALLLAYTSELGNNGIAHSRHLIRPITARRSSKNAGYLPEMLMVQYADATLAVEIFKRVQKENI